MTERVIMNSRLGKTSIRDGSGSDGGARRGLLPLDYPRWSMNWLEEWCRVAELLARDGRVRAACLHVEGDTLPDGHLSSLRRLESVEREYLVESIYRPSGPGYVTFKYHIDALPRSQTEPQVIAALLGERIESIHLSLWSTALSVQECARYLSQTRDQAQAEPWLHWSALREGEWFEAHGTTDGIEAAITAFERDQPGSPG